MKNRMIEFAEAVAKHKSFSYQLEGFTIDEIKKLVKKFRKLGVSYRANTG